MPATSAPWRIERRVSARRAARASGGISAGGSVISRISVRTASSLVGSRAMARPTSCSARVRALGRAGASGQGERGVACGGPRVVARDIAPSREVAVAVEVALDRIDQLAHRGKAIDGIERGGARRRRRRAPGECRGEGRVRWACASTPARVDSMATSGVPCLCSGSSARSSKRMAPARRRRRARSTFSPRACSGAM